MSETPTYALGTTVSVERSRFELDALLGKHGATQRGVLHDEDNRRACCVFVLGGRKYRLDVPMPTEAECRKRIGRYQGSYAERLKKEISQAVRERWRGLLLLVKAKLEVVRMGALTAEREFLADLVLPNGQTAHEEIGAYMQKLLRDGYTAPLALPEGPR